MERLLLSGECWDGLFSPPFAVHIRKVALSDLPIAEEDWSALADALLSEVEHRRWQELRGRAVAKRWKQWLLGRLAAKQAVLGDDTGRFRRLALLPDERGYPRLYEQGQPSRSVVTIAHSGDTAVAACSAQGRRIGIDLEWWSALPAERLDGLAERIFSAEERAVLEPGWPRSLLYGWVAKEAVSKLTGQGFRGGHRQYVLTMLNEHGAQVSHEGHSYPVAFAVVGRDGVMALAWEG